MQPVLWKKPAGGLPVIEEKDARCDCDSAIQTNGFSEQVSQVSGKLMEEG